MTFLFTDIEGSTRLWETAREQMTAALELHDALLRQAIAQHDGYVFSTGGDGFAAAFARADASVRAALDAQAALADAHWPTPTPIRVRMGLHTGEAAERDGDYFGPTVNRTARLMATAHGGQTVCSAVTAGIVGDETGAAPRDLGEHRLRDLLAPQRIFQLGDGRFPPLRSVDSVPSNLPTMVTDLIGRTDDIDAYTALLQTTRLLTLTGAGGVGKTRLALAVAAAVAPDHPDGCWFVPFGPVRDPADVVRTVAESLQAPATAAASRDALVRHLADRQLLLVLDNCEHLLDEIAALADELQRHGADLALVATSREPLGLDGEVVRRVRSLAVPTDADADAVQDSPAVRLFVERARAADGSFALTPANGEAVVQICRQLDGIPLAIELAAARTRAMPAEDIARRLHERFRLLGGGRRAEERQRTLLAAVQWSHDLLTDDERVVFRRLAVFPATFDADAAQAVAAGDDLDEFDVLDHLVRLVERSLVQHEGGGRYRLLETLRQYAADRLAETGETDGTRAAHASYFLSSIESMQLDSCGPRYTSLASRLLDDLENVRAAVATFQDNGDWEAVHELCRAAYVFLFEHLPSEALRWWTAAFDHGAPAAPAAIVDALGRAAMMASLCDWPGVAGPAGRSDRLASEADVHPSPWAAAAVAMLTQNSGDVERGSVEWHAALDRSVVVDDEFARITALGALANIYASRGDREHALSFAADSVARATAVGHPAYRASAAICAASARLTLAAGNDDFEEALTALAVSGVPSLPQQNSFSAWVVSTEVVARLALGRPVDLAALAAAIRSGERTGADFGMAAALDTLALACQRAGRLEDGARLVGYVTAHLAGYRMYSIGWRWVWEAAEAGLDALDPAHRRRLLAEGAALDRKALVALLRENEAADHR